MNLRAIFVLGAACVGACDPASSGRTATTSTGAGTEPAARGSTTAPFELPPEGYLLWIDKRTGESRVRKVSELLDSMLENEIRAKAVVRIEETVYHDANGRACGGTQEMYDKAGRLVSTRHGDCGTGAGYGLP